MDRNDPVSDAKKCSHCDRSLVFFATGANIVGEPEESRQVLYKCPHAHELWAYKPASQTWRRER
jgi:hypothetical protein